MTPQADEIELAADAVATASVDSGDTSGAGDLRRAAARGGLAIVSGRFAVQFLTLGVTFLVARLLRPYDYGVATTSSLFLGFADALATVGLGVALVQREHLTREAMKEVFTVTLALSILMVVALVVASESLARFFQTPELAQVLRVSSLVLLLIPFRTVSQSLLERRLQLGRFAAIMTIFTVVQAAIILIAALAGLAYWSLVLGYLVSRVLETVVLLYQARWRPGLRLPGSESRELFGFGGRYMGSGLLWQVYSQSDVAVVGRLLGPQVLGIYSLAFQSISIPANRLAASLGQVSYTIFCRMQDQPERMRDWYFRLNRILAAVGLPVFIGMMLVASDAVATVLGPRWMSAVEPVRLLCLPGYVLYLNATFHSVLNARGRPDLPMRFNALYALILPPLFLLFGMIWGLPGICLVWMVAYPLISGVYFAMSRSVTGFGLRELAHCHVPAVKASVVMLVAVVLIQSYLVPGEEAMIRLIVAVLAGAMTYLGGIWVLGRETVFRDLGTLLRDLRRCR